MPYNNIQPNADFDWDLYADGYNGGSKLVINRKVKTKNPKDKVYSHEPYAQELEDRMNAYYEHVPFKAKTVCKDMFVGNTYDIIDIYPVSSCEVGIDSDNGMTAVVDMNKETQFLDAINCSSIEMFMKAITFVEDFKRSLLENHLTAVVNNTGRVSLWDGLRSKVENALVSQLNTPEDKQIYFNAHVVEINNGGYFVDISGVRCFMPGSLAAAGIITNFESMLGKTVPVMVVNYLPKSGFVVSYKKYLNRILPDKIKKELAVGMMVSARVTGASKNGLFVIFKDNDGEWVYSGLVHRSVMSRDFERRFDSREFINGDEFHMYITAINEENGKIRIVLTDSMDIVRANMK